MSQTAAQRLACALRSLIEDERRGKGKVADAAGIAASYITEFLKGDGNPTIDVVDRLAHALNVDIVDLFPRSVSEPTHAPDGGRIATLVETSDASAADRLLAGEIITPAEFIGAVATITRRLALASVRHKSAFDRATPPRTGTKRPTVRGGRRRPDRQPDQRLKSRG